MNGSLKRYLREIFAGASVNGQVIGHLEISDNDDGSTKVAFWGSSTELAVIDLPSNWHQHEFSMDTTAISPEDFAALRWCHVCGASCVLDRSKNAWVEVQEPLSSL